MRGLLATTLCETFCGVLGRFAATLDKIPDSGQRLSVGLCGGFERLCATMPGDSVQRLLLDWATLSGATTGCATLVSDYSATLPRLLPATFPRLCRRLSSDFRKIFRKSQRLWHGHARKFSPGRGGWPGRDGRRQPLGRGMVQSWAACHAAMQGHTDGVRTGCAALCRCDGWRIVYGQYMHNITESRQTDRNGVFTAFCVTLDRMPMWI